MDIRKIIKFGNSSHVVSLPTNWVKKNKLSKGDLIYINENGNNELVFSPKIIEKEDELREVTLNVEGKDIEQIERELIATYINHNDVVSLVSKDFKSNLGEIRKIVNSLIGFEITHHSPDKIVIKDFLNLNDVSIVDMIRKVDLIVRSMLDNLILCFNKRECANVYDQDIDVNKLSFLVLRVVKRSLDDPWLGKKMEMDNFQLLETWILITKLEKIADALKRIYALGNKLDLDNSEMKKLNSLLLKLKDSYLKVMNSYHSMDCKMAYEAASLKRGYMLDCEKLFDKKNNSNVIKIVERLKDIQTYMGDIARVTYMQDG